LTHVDPDRARQLLHDLRTPLALVKGYAELLQVRADDRTRREAPPRILEAADRLSLLLEQLAVELGVGVAPPAEAPAPRSSYAARLSERSAIKPDS
jgi:hypothetical protein